MSVRAADINGTPIDDKIKKMIRDYSDYDRQFVVAMVKLKRDDIIEYKLKINQIMKQSEQQRNAVLIVNIQTIPVPPFLQVGRILYGFCVFVLIGILPVMLGKAVVPINFQVISTCGLYLIAAYNCLVCS